MRIIEKIWFTNHQAKWLLVPLLLPLSLLFWLLTLLRRAAFRVKLIKSYQIMCPVIVVGNISVGGNGKTPVVIYLLNLAVKMGFSPGVISRGYGGDIHAVSSNKNYPYLLDDNSVAVEVGDEPLLLYKRCHVPVVVGSDRVASAKLLVAQGCNLIISDDGLQHYRLIRDIEFIVVDSKRLHGNGLLLPAGPLREGKWRLNQVDMIVYNGIDASGDFHHSKHKNAISMTLAAHQVCNVLTGESIQLNDFIHQHGNINAIAGIGSPQRFFDMLLVEKFSLKSTQSFVDHHNYQLSDFNGFDNKLPLLMTEKDAVKCIGFAQAHWWYIPVDSIFSTSDEQQLVKQLAKLQR